MNAMYFSEAALEGIARTILTSYHPNYLNAAPQPVPIEYIIEEVYGLTIEYKRLSKSGKMLGKTIFDDGWTSYFDLETGRYEFIKQKAGTMMIEESLIDDNMGRLRFTMAHELAHWVIHQQLYKGTGEIAAFIASDQDSSTEWQANTVANRVLMPKGQIKRCFYSLVMKPNGRHEIAQRMAEIFGVSKQAMEIRLRESRLL
ncbi:MAG: ImmA/IrrE family metallo-endopeptidase [Eubacteriales bacterium]|nr:ImmA/IrrE family metallo-endopeptidase [Eubacteriales bacterium]